MNDYTKLAWGVYMIEDIEAAVAEERERIAKKAETWAELITTSGLDANVLRGFADEIRRGK